MTTINLKDFYYWYTQDQFIEVSDEVLVCGYIGLCDTVQPNTARNFRLDGIRVAASG